MPARTIEQQQDATCFSVVVICLIIAIISNVNYLKTDSEAVKKGVKIGLFHVIPQQGIYIYPTIENILST